MKYKINFKSLLFLLLFFTFLIAENNSKEKISFIEAVNKHRSYLISRANDTLLYLSDYHKGLFLDCVRNPIPEDMDMQGKKGLLNRIILSGKKLSAKKALNFDVKITFFSDFIEDEIIYNLCIVAFKDDHLRDQAYEVLIKHSRADYLKKYNTEIKEYIHRIWDKIIEDNKKSKIKRLPYDELYMLLTLSKSEEKELLDKIDKRYIPNNYLARLGNKKAENELIDRFKKASQYKKRGNSESKAYLAYTLGIAGTSACAKALIEELSSSVADERTSGNYKSIRVPIIKALGRIHPEAPFLRIDIAFIDQEGDRTYGGKDRISSYLNKIIRWAEITYNTTPVEKSFKPLLSRVRPE